MVKSVGITLKLSGKEVVILAVDPLRALKKMAPERPSWYVIMTPLETSVDRSLTENF